jgi:hypothetical protein
MDFSHPLGCLPARRAERRAPALLKKVTNLLYIRDTAALSGASVISFSEVLCDRVTRRRHRGY